MFRTLHGKLSLVLLGLLLLVGLFWVPLTLFAARVYMQEVNQRLSRTLAEHLTEGGILRRDGRVAPQATGEIEKLMAINPSIEVYLLDADGVILAYSAPPGEVKRTRVALDPIRRFLGGSAPLPIQGDDPRDPSRRKTFSVSPVPMGKGPVQGYVYVILGGEEYDSVAELLGRSYILRLSAAITAGILLVVLLTGLVLFHLLTRRLRGLTQAVEAFEKRDFAGGEPFAPPVPPRDEIDRLGVVITRMGRRIQEQFHGLRQADRQRRELVGNVSHDLRTPLAALQGYLETLLIKEKELSAEQRREYLGIAIRHSERLSKLVAALFELAKLDAGDSAIRPEPFSAGELVQDVAQQYRLVAEKKRLTLEVRFDPDLPFVHADIGLIERVLENLIENALRHTPEGGVITLALGRPENGALSVEVADTGRGIPAEDLPHIFERSYRAEKDRPDTGGLGLGLAIARRILELHGSAITVRSAPGAGTAFTFHLPVYQQSRDKNVTSS